MLENYKPFKKTSVRLNTVST